VASPDASSPRPVGPPDDGTVALAFSGDGKRAALFSLGALMALVDAGVNPRVAAITSVSGGSITNAAVAHRADLQSTTPEKFNELCDRLATELITKRHRTTAPIVVITMFLTFVFLQLLGPGRVVNELIDSFSVRRCSVHTFGMVSGHSWRSQHWGSPSLGLRSLVWPRL